MSTDGTTSKAVNEMTPVTKEIWKSHEDNETKSFVGHEAQIRHFRRSGLAKDTIKRILIHTKLARKRYSGSFGDGPWDATKKPSNATAKRRKVACRRRRRRRQRRQRRRRDKAVIAVFKEIHKAAQEASRRTHAQSTVRFGRVERACRKEKGIAFKRQSSAMTNSKTIQNERGAVDPSLPQHPAGMQMLPTARSVSHLQTTTRHVALGNDRLQNRTQSGGADASTRLSPDFANGSSSQAWHKMGGDTPGLSIDWGAILSDTHRPLQANDTYSDNSFAPRSRRDTYDFGHRRRKTSESSSRKIHLGHNGYVAEGSQDEAHIPRQDLSHPITSLHMVDELVNEFVGKEEANSRKAERDKKDISGLLHTSTTDNKKRGLPSESKTVTISDPNSDGRGNTEERAQTEKLVVNIPADTDMATDVRAYSQWPGMHALTHP